MTLPATTAYEDVRPGDPLLVALELGVETGVDARVEMLQDAEKSSVHRLSWWGPQPRTCVVKQYRTAVGGYERDFYRHLAHRLSVPTLHCYGSVEAEDGLVRLALEDDGDRAPSFESPGSRALLTEWAAALHMGGTSIAAASLPDAGPDRYARRLADTTARLVSRLEIDELDEKDRAILERCLDRCRQVSSVWPDLEQVCRRFPPTLVHGDLVEENLRLRATPAGPVLIALDWEKVGWGAPAVDLVRVDPDLYWSRAQRWLGGTRAEFDQLVRAGLIFRVIAHRWAEKSIRKVQHAESRLSRLLAEIDA